MITERQFDGLVGEAEAGQPPAPKLQPKRTCNRQSSHGPHDWRGLNTRHAGYRCPGRSAPELNHRRIVESAIIWVKIYDKGSREWSRDGDFLDRDIDRLNVLLEILDGGGF